MHIGIMSAMLEENELFKNKLSSPEVNIVGKREFTRGNLWGQDVTVTFSRWGKVASAIAATHLIVKHNVDAIIFCGVAASCSPSTRLGDVVIANHAVQHDMDARPIFERCEIPLIGQTAFEMDQHLTNSAFEGAQDFFSGEFKNFNQSDLDQFGITSPKVHRGTIASGDKFFASREDLVALQEVVPGALCVEMEGASVAQVCYEHGVPCSVIRTISDSGEESSPEQFQNFISTIASAYSLGILRETFVKAGHAAV